MQATPFHTYLSARRLAGLANYEALIPAYASSSNLMYYNVLSFSPMAFCKTVEQATARLDDGGEKEHLSEIKSLAEKITVIGKMIALQSALESCSAMLKRLKLPRKTIMFTTNLRAG